MLIDLVTLEEIFCLRAETCMVFPSKLSDTTIWETISCFQVQITNIIKYMDHICCFYSWCVDSIELDLILDNKLILMTAFETNILYCYDLDICSYFETFNFYYDCWNQISGGSKPKFGIFNKILQLCYQYYFSMLEDLTFAKKTVITWAYLVIINLKVRPNNNFNPGLYRSICGHLILMP